MLPCFLGKSLPALNHECPFSRFVGKVGGTFLPREKSARAVLNLVSVKEGF
jgi:hypothetical protein